jgi:hypothetical protein
MICRRRVKDERLMLEIIRNSFVFKERLLSLINVVGTQKSFLLFQARQLLLPYEWMRCS